MRKAEVVIFGGGIIGCALAEELARRGARVTLIERGLIGAEASSAAAGILSAQMDLEQPGPLFDLCQAARQLYPRWVTHLERRSGIHVGFHVDGILYVAMTARETVRMAQRAHWQAKLGLRVERWSPKALRRNEPSVDGRVHTGFYFPTEAQVDNPLLMQALARACRKAGVMVREEESVRRLLVTRGVVQGVVTNRRTLRTPIVVNCLGSWAAMDGRFPVPMPVEPARGQILVFNGPKRLFRHAVMGERAYVVQRRDGRLIVGSTIEHVGFEKALTLEGIHSIVCGLRHMSSALNQCTFRDAWAGFRPYTKNRLPILGATSIPGLYVATGHFRHGILLAPITAQLMTALILQHQTPFDLSPFTLR